MATEQVIDRITPCEHPGGKGVGSQAWRNLFFLHWRLPVETIRSLIPKELTIDTFEGDAWLGLVPFAMRKVRPWWSPVVPYVSNFWETNLRTYVHFRGERPGVWFFTLEANSRLAAFVASRFWHLNYNYSKLYCQQSENLFSFAGERPFGVERRHQYSLKAQYEGTLPHTFEASPGTLEHFLAERYLLYTTDQQGRLLEGQVHHRPYPLLPGVVAEYEGTIIKEAVGHEVSTCPDHVLFSPGVEVEMFGLKQVDLA